MYYTIIQKQVIHGNAGDYEVWCEKEKCNDFYLFRAKQISVWVGEQHYHIDTNLTRVRLYHEPFEFTAEMFAMQDTKEAIPLKCTVDEIDLYYLGGGYKGKITNLKHYFRSFCQGVVLEPRNEARRVDG